MTARRKPREGFRPMFQPVFRSVFQLGVEPLEATEIAVTTADLPTGPKPDKGDKIEGTTSRGHHTARKTTPPML